MPGYVIHIAIATQYIKKHNNIKNEEEFMLAQAQYYRNEKIKPMIDEKYGKGASEFFSQAIEAVYNIK